MKAIRLSIMLICVSWSAVAEDALPLCVAAREDMPQSWQPSDGVAERLSDAPWSKRETEDVAYAIRTGLQEMLDHFTQKPGGIEAMWEDAVGALIEVTYSSANPPEIDAAARDGAMRNLEVLTAPYLEREPAAAVCEDFESLMPLAMYADRFYGPEDARTRALVANANAAFGDCGTLQDAMGVDYKAIFQNPAAPHGDVFDLVIWSLLFIEAELIEGLELPETARQFSPELWEFLMIYELKGADAYEDGAWDEDYIEMAYLATHIAYIPTGNHRHPIYIEDSPGLYRYHRENFYPSLDMGELDLVAEFVDSLRQYGCTAENDAQVRDGTRYLLHVFHGGNDSWMAYREPGETDAEVDAYDLVHKAWTGVLGVRPRVLEPALPGTYGGIVRRWLPEP